MTGLAIIVAAVLVASPVGTFGGPVPASPQQPPAASSGTYVWPLRGQVIHAFEAPAGPYGPGHRGIDIAAPFGSQVVAAQDGVVAFAGSVAGSLFVSVDHPDGIRTTYSWLSKTAVRKGETVRKGDAVGTTGHGHPGEPTPHLHFGARIGDVYIDPMLLLEGGSIAGVIRLAPLEAA